MLNNSETESHSDCQLDSSLDSNESDDHAEAEADTGSDNDSVTKNTQAIKIVQHDFDKIIFTAITVW